MQNVTFVGVRLALYIGGLLARGVMTIDEVDEEIREKMHDEQIPESDFESIQRLAYEFMKFGEHIRAAERKNLPITRFHGEQLPDH